MNSDYKLEFSDVIYCKQWKIMYEMNSYPVYWKFNNSTKSNKCG